ncbi:MAG: sulfur oxidation c-type cytochrome SoxX [Xanthobacteraceae bacterium]|nr:sulfur oxidation c-type cytochrome SoxX [Xanthobacteraceae bacterium]
MRMKTLVIAVAALVAAPALAQQKPDPARLDAMIKAAFPTAPADWQSRFVGDETMKECSETHNSPSKAASEAILKREKANIKYPADGQFMGDWKNGEKLAQSGYGLRFSDYPPRGVNGGNCYACHQLTKAEVSYGTVGPSLLGYGKLRKFAEADVKAAYERIYNSNAALACSLMPRFGVNNVLTVDQIKDLVALLMSPDSPVNK